MLKSNINCLQLFFYYQWMEIGRHGLVGLNAQLLVVMQRKTEQEAVPIHHHRMEGKIVLDLLVILESVTLIHFVQVIFTNVYTVYTL